MAATPYLLYYSPGACSLSPHIALLETDQSFTLERVDLRTKQTASGEDYLAINPNGYVPTLRLPDGNLLTEGAVTVQYIADQRPASQLAPPAGTFARYRMLEWLSFIGTELHKGMAPFYNALASDDYKTQLAGRFAKRWAHVEKLLDGKPFLFGDHFTIIDGYMFYVLRAWQRSAKRELAEWPGLVAYYQALAIRPTIAAALAAEGIAA
jgi:glutathione S-transferase